MPTKLAPAEVLERLITRIEKLIEALKGVKLPGYEVAIAELEVEHTYLLRAKRYLERQAGLERAPYPRRSAQWSRD